MTDLDTVKEELVGGDCIKAVVVSHNISGLIQLYGGDPAWLRSFLAHSLDAHLVRMFSTAAHAQALPLALRRTYDPYSSVTPTEIELIRSILVEYGCELAPERNFEHLLVARRRDVRVIALP